MIAAVPFEQQQPAAQAMLQAVMKELVRNAKRDGLNPRLLQLLPRIPLMHTGDYMDLLLLAVKGGVWWCFANNLIGWAAQCVARYTVGTLQCSVVCWLPVQALL
jgi:hypothetical protein